MEWTIDPITERPTLATGACTATVWNSGRHGYAATITHRGMATAKYGFDTLEAAQAWCLTQLAGLRVSGKCTSVTLPTDDD
jgi:hypothetical protein